MENGAFVGLSRQMVLRRQMDLVANNIANISTPAFKGERMVFIEYLAQTEGEEELSYVQDVAQVRNVAEGSLTTTGNTYDLAIKGDAYFVLDTPLGERYTRNGHFTLDESGQITNTQGDPVLGVNNQPIVIPEDAVSVTIAADGTISAGASEAFEASNEIGQIKLVSFADEQALDVVGSSLYATDQPPLPAPDSVLFQGMVEESNVQPILEITRMIATQRAYEAAAKLVETADELERLAIETLTRVA